MMPKSLREVMQDTPEAYVKRAEIVVKIKEAVTENRFNVEDDSLSIYVEFTPEATKFRSRIEVGKTYRFFSLEKINPETLLLKKNSFLLEDKTAKEFEIDGNSFITTKDLLDKPENTVLKEKLMMKVLRIYELRQTSNGIEFRKILLGDQYFQLHITLWRQHAKDVAKYFEENHIYCLTNFAIDSWPKDTNKEKPKDIKFDARRTKIEKVKPENIPKHFDSVEQQNNCQVLVGEIRFLDDIYEYTSCPGKSQFCGKAVKPGQVFCTKIGCSLKLDTSSVIKDYRVKLMLCDNNDDFHTVTAFSKSLKPFEQNGDTIDKKLEKIMGRTVKLFINPSKSDDDPILNKLEFSE